MSTLKSSAEDLTLNADGSGNDIIIQSNASTKAIVTAEGTVGIGTDSPSRLLTLYGDTGIALQNSTTGTGTGNGTHIWVNSEGSGELLIQNRENSDIEFLTNDTVRMRILAAGGLCFGTDTSADNALSDYEEGTWTPRIKSNSGEGSGTAYSSQTARYTKIGNIVHCSFSLTVSSEGTFSGSYIMLAGLPFTISSVVDTVNLGMLYFNGLDDSTITLGLQAEHGNTQCYLWTKTNSSTGRTYLDVTGFGTAMITAQFSYRV